MNFALPTLPYSTDALEPHISARTLDYHYNKHHAGYVNNLNTLLKDHGSVFDGMTLEQVIQKAYGVKDYIGIFNNAAQVWNHSFYWKSMKPRGGGRAYGSLLKQIDKDFGSFDSFLEEFKAAAATQFASGWAWLSLERDIGKLSISKTSNADTPVVEEDKFVPILTMDVWEHAYYLDFQNKRVDYIAMFMSKLVNWDFAQENYEEAQS